MPVKFGNPGRKDNLQTSKSSAKSCEATVEILADMSEMALLRVTNPFGFES
jgi:hypothetical protein